MGPILIDIGWVDRNNFIKVLDALKLSRNLNDQELLTLVRRFKVKHIIIKHVFIYLQLGGLNELI